MAPFEADAELAYLSTSGRVDAVLTEDSDLLAYMAAKRYHLAGKNRALTPIQRK